MRFNSDNTSTVCPELLAALAAVNHEHVTSYGGDPWTLRLDAAFSEFFGTEVRAFSVTTGTAANALGIATVVPPYGAIYAHEEAHIERDECGAPEFFSGGAKLVTLKGDDAKLTPSALREALDAYEPTIHTVQPTALHLSQATELGTTYRPHEIAALAQVARASGLKLIMDGARLANALAFLECHPGEVTWRAGVDVLAFGASKNGALAAEAVIFFDPSLVRDFELRRKRAGHLISKSRYTAAQLLAYVDPAVWHRNARRANDFARRVAEAARNLLMHPVEANEVFLELPVESRERLRAQGFEFSEWGVLGGDKVRLVMSWDDSAEDVAALCRALEAEPPPRQAR